MQSAWIHHKVQGEAGSRIDPHQDHAGAQVTRGAPLVHVVVMV